MRIDKYNEAWFDDQDDFLHKHDKIYDDNQSPGVTGDDDIVSNPEEHKDNDTYELGYKIKIVDKMKEMGYHRDDSGPTLKEIRMDIDEIEN